MSTAFTIKSNGFAAAQRKLLQMGSLDLHSELLENVGALVESQTRQRIQEDKIGPDGQAWAEWSERYGRTRNSGQSLLQSEGDLLDSIQYLVGRDVVEVGSNLIYAATHQYGDDARGIPARPYLGLSDEDERELDELLRDVVQDFLNA